MHGSPVTVAAIGDLHCDRRSSDSVAEVLRGAAEAADLLLLAGDLTTHGGEEEAALLAGHISDLEKPVVAVLGNHDWHAGHSEEITACLQEAGAAVLDRNHTTVQVGDSEVGIAGGKGFVGGFAGSHLPDFGEPLLRDVYAETGAEVAGLEASLTAIATCHFRLVLLHYSPALETLAGEPHGIHVMLGSDRLAAPIREHEPNAVFHGHAHLGSPEATIGEVPVFNVSLPVTQGRPFIYELEPGEAGAGPVH